MALMIACALVMEYNQYQEVCHRKVASFVGSYLARDPVPSNAVHESQQHSAVTP